MKPASYPLKAYLDAARRSDAPLVFADCFTITLATLDAFHLTNYDQNIVWNGTTFVANSALIDGLKYKCATGLEVDKQQITIAAYPGVWTNTLQTLMGFYLARGGARGTFLFIDPDFNSMTGQGIGAGDGTTVVFSFVRTFGGQVEPVGWVTAVAAVYLAGAPVTSGWTVSGNAITFATPPASGVVVSADFSYGFVCRFLEDTIDFEEFMDNLWQLKSLKFRQVRL